jgi:ATP-dependent DNA ligase
MKTWPTLYKKTSTGAIQKWDIGVEEIEFGNAHKNEGSLPAIVTIYGQLGTDSPQRTEDIIREGKNAGKKNATNAYQQADAEAQAKWEKQKKKGYVETIAAAEAGELDELIEGGIVPMLAHKFSEQGHKIKYPAYAQPKLDGIRCIAIIKEGKCTLWSRTRKPITSMPHIVAEIEKIGFLQNTILDGELYNHEFKSDFEKIVSAVRKQQAEEGYLNVQYHIYDTVRDQDFGSRTMFLRSLFGIHEKNHGELKYLKRVQTLEVCNESELMDAFDLFRSQGYEGAMARNDHSPYVNKRSYDLLKIKEFDDAEFKIVGVEEGRGKLAGHAGSFVCRTTDGKEFLAKMRGETSELKRYFEDRALWDGKLLTVQYQGLTGAQGVPRFPVGVRIREAE